MERKYKVYLGNQPVGDAFLKEEGLYIHYICTCELPNDDIFRILVEAASKQVNLGICVPKGSVYETRGKIPAKYLQDLELKFTVKTATQEEKLFVPIAEDQQFIYIDRLKNSYFTTKDGKTGIQLNI